jgi:hypothetical protein
MGSKESKDDEKGPSKFEETAGENVSLAREIFDFLKDNKKWWLLPIISTFFVISVLLLLSSTAAAPFIYTLF